MTEPEHRCHLTTASAARIRKGPASSDSSQVVRLYLDSVPDDVLLRRRHVWVGILFANRVLDNNEP
jgi:hypothetical protein